VFSLSRTPLAPRSGHPPVWPRRPERCWCQISRRSRDGTWLLRRRSRFLDHQVQCAVVAFHRGISVSSETATNARAAGFTKALAWAAGPPVEWTVVREPRPGASSRSVPSGKPGRTCRQGDEGERPERQASMRLSLTLRSVRRPAGDAGPRSSQPAVRRSPRWDRHQYRAGRSRRSGRGSRRPR